jgi:hypothetical protein
VKTLLGIYAALAVCVAYACLAGGGCKKKTAHDLAAEAVAEANPAASPPPVAHGKCVDDEYENTVVTKQTCTLDGTVWKCAAQHDAIGALTGTISCARQGAVDPEAAEVPADAPHAAGYYGGATYGVDDARRPFWLTPDGGTK